MSVISARKNSDSQFGQWHGDAWEDSTRTQLCRFAQKPQICSVCCGFYGPCFGQPLCHTCHAFLFPEDINIPDGSYFLQDKTDSEDSGTEEPEDFYEMLNRTPLVKANGQRQQARPKITIKRPRLDKLSECIIALTCPKKMDVIADGLMDSIPSEVLSVIFSYLDDLSLWHCSRVCRQWASIINSENADVAWRHRTRDRWPLFKPSFRVLCWHTMYSKLALSAPCIQCIYEIAEQATKVNTVDWKWWHVRIRNEVRALRNDPPEGIECVPLDQKHYSFQASITGPTDSPYEGGVFFLSLQIPQKYPMKPPVVRFITKIFHPNVSRHGNIGLDSIHDNWSLVLTISKVLISIQSLLTDPYCDVCMEPDIGRLYQENRTMFDATARLWTLKYAMYYKMPSDQQAMLLTADNR